jgi:putative NADH-flavin reductase
MTITVIGATGKIGTLVAAGCWRRGSGCRASWRIS